MANKILSAVRLPIPPHQHMDKGIVTQYAAESKTNFGCGLPDGYFFVSAARLAMMAA